MVYSVRFLLTMVCLGFVLTGCAFMSDEDRDFYGKGWVNPRDLDKTPPHHAIPDPSHPEYQESDRAPVPAAAATPEPQWLMPEQGQR